MKKIPSLSIWLILILTSLQGFSQFHTITIKRKWYTNLYETSMHAVLLGEYTQTKAHAVMVNDPHTKIKRVGPYKPYKPDTSKIFEPYRVPFATIYSAYNAEHHTDKYTGIDFGHVNPFEAFAFEPQAALECNLYTNLCPQAGYVNEHQWQKVEAYVLDSIAPFYDNVKVWTGVLVSRTNPRAMGVLFIPDYYWKVIEYKQGGQIKQMAWLALNKETNKSTKEVDCRKDIMYLKNLIAKYYKAAEFTPPF